MSGHSKWSTIKRKKGALDAKKGQLFTRLGKTLSIAAKEGGPDPNSNFTLRLAIETARKANMPMTNIERAVKRGAGEDGEAFVTERAVYGGYGPGGIAVVVDTLTDNKNRTVSEVRRAFEDHGGTFAEVSSVLWQFKEMGRVTVKCAKVKKSEKYGGADEEVPTNRDEVMMEMMDIAGVQDVKEGEDPMICEIYTGAKDLASTRDLIEKTGYIIEGVQIVKVPDNPQSADDKTVEKLGSLLEALSELEDVEDVWVNADI